jgi:hypothetical protein
VAFVQLVQGLVPGMLERRSGRVIAVDETVPTELYQLSEQLGAVANPVPASQMYTPELVAEALVWMTRQPLEWSGRCVGFEDLRRAGVLPPHEGPIGGFAGDAVVTK